VKCAVKGCAAVAIVGLQVERRRLIEEVEHRAVYLAPRDPFAKKADRRSVGPPVGERTASGGRAWLFGRES
jgi:hypothetical protein